MSNELQALERWITSGFFSDTSDIQSEISIALLADAIYEMSFPPIEGLEIKVLTMVVVIHLYKYCTIQQPNVQNIYDALVAQHISAPYEESNKLTWMNNFLTVYKENNIKQQ